ncbi:HipA family kinase [Neobacillus bataviensis]|uniref:HipA family kinase n=1 Tax=Neobacillus bataviensis TaxID=220685 RepID=UPI001CBFF449|nr:HipA family kinase [Neobacillus bataviensis]
MESMGLLKYPVKFVQTLRGGTAHVILFNDGKKYVVKWNGTTRKRAKEAVNEFVAAQLATLLALPVVPFELVYIPDEFIKKNPELQSKIYKFRPGCQYACLFIENSIVLKELETLPSKTEVKNQDMLAAMAVFDQWVYNSDRTMSNWLLERLSDGSYYFHMIDHGKCFPGGYKWSPKTLRQKQKYNMKYQESYQWIFSILNKEDFTSYVEKIISIPNKLIYEVIQSIPEEWAVSKKESEALYYFLVNHKNSLPKVIDKFIKKYNNNSSNKKKR